MLLRRYCANLEKYGSVLPVLFNFLARKMILIMYLKVRAKHDMTVVAGCATGGVLSAKGNVFSHHSNLLPCKSRNQLAKSVRSLLQMPP